MREINFTQKLEQLFELFQADPTLTEVILNGFDSVNGLRFAERGYRRLSLRPGFKDTEQFSEWLMEFSYRHSRRLDPGHPAQGGEARRGHYRWHAVLPPLAHKGVFCLRRNSFLEAKFETLFDGVPSKDILALEDAVQSDAHVIFCGPTGSGKTTCLVAIMKKHWSDRRVCILERSPEITIDLPGWVYLRAQDLNHDGRGEYTLLQLLVQALRLSPEKICFSELRGEEIPAFLTGVNTGHGGTMSTMHVSTSNEFLNRIEKYAGTRSLSLSQPILLCFLLPYNNLSHGGGGRLQIRTEWVK